LVCDTPFAIIRLSGVSATKLATFTRPSLLFDDVTLNPDASHFSFPDASAFPAATAGKGDFVAVNPDRVGPSAPTQSGEQGVMDAG
jgi:hypothetical protein